MLLLFQSSGDGTGNWKNFAASPHCGVEKIDCSTQCWCITCLPGLLVMSLLLSIFRKERGNVLFCIIFHHSGFSWPLQLQTLPRTIWNHDPDWLLEDVRDLLSVVLSKYLCWCKHLPNHIFAEDVNSAIQLTCILTLQKLPQHESNEQF